MQEKSRLSYVELVTVVLAVSMVSIQAVPRLSQATEGSRTRDMIERLETMRTQLALYHAQHDNTWPPSDSFESFKVAMTTGQGRREPYVREIPVNPCNGMNAVRFDGEPAGANKAGWRFDTQTGLFQADSGPAYSARWKDRRICDRRGGWQPAPGKVLL
ncbi:MAG: hypothetical protein ACYSWO_21245 [Planctomycetota bacterium]|jgi:hypothetical protein